MCMYLPKPYFRLHLLEPKRSLLETFNSKPYRFNFTQKQLQNHISKGNIKIFQKAVLPTYDLKNDQNITGILNNKDWLEPFVVYSQHIHETPIHIPPNFKIEIIYRDENTIVTNKPCGIPVHPVQRYYQNTVQYMISKQLGIGMEVLKPIHRLDKLTSGVLIWALNEETVRLFKQSGLKKEKIYLAKVKGKFGVETKIRECTDDVVYLYPTREMIKLYQNCKTEFKMLEYNSVKNESLISAKLFTGYPHQIRIHLRNLKFPIIGDPLYNSETGKYREILKSKEEVTAEYWRLVKERGDCIKTEKLVSEGEVCNICGAEEFHTSMIPHMSLHAWKYTYKDPTTNKQMYQFIATPPNWADKQ